MKNLLTKLFFITLVLSAQNLFAAWGGTGTVGHPYTISNATDLALLSTNVNNGTAYSGIFFQQTADIISLGSWTAIGIAGGNSFQGTYNGNGHKITGMTINTSTDNQGLFGYISGATISNLGVENVNISASGSKIGGLIGFAEGTCAISNCYSTGTVGSGGYVGGLVGDIDNASTTVISNCYTSGTVQGGNPVGGLVSGTSPTTSILNCYSTSSVTSIGGYYWGGLIGFNSGNISNCYRPGAVSGSGGGMIGLVSGYSSITYCFWDMQTSGQSTSRWWKWSYGQNHSSNENTIYFYHCPC